MATVLFAMGGYGAYLGWQIRDGKGGEPTFGTSDSAAELHPARRRAAPPLHTRRHTRSRRVASRCGVSRRG